LPGFHWREEAHPEPPSRAPGHRPALRSSRRNTSHWPH
jgi:hypothetical protein